MSHQELTDALETLHHQLAGSTTDLDPDDVQKLRQTMKEIESVLETKQSPETGLSENLSASARSFEESHPKLTEILGRIADMLQQMGI